MQSARDMVNAGDAPASGSVGLPIPGFDFTADSPEPTPTPTTETPMDASVDDNIVSRTEKEMKPSMASVRNMEISIIIQEGAAPELIENIRQVVMVASRFNRPRGDVLSIMTASFKERRDEKSAEQVLLKNIAEKLETLESQRERLGEVDWKKELENYKESESDRRDEDRLYFQSKLAELEASARDKSYDQERQSMLEQDSIRLQALNDEIQNLKSFLGAANISDSTAHAVQSNVQEKLQERNSLDSQISEKLAMLDQAQSELDRQSSGRSSGTGMVILVSVLSALVIGLIVALIFMLVSKPKQQVPPPWMMYPPRRPKKKANEELDLSKVAEAFGGYIVDLNASFLSLKVVASRDMGGFMLNLLLGTIAVCLSIPLGIALALGRQSGMPIIKWICVVFIEFIRGVPLITLLFVANVIYILKKPCAQAIVRLILFCNF